MPSMLQRLVLVLCFGYAVLGAIPVHADPRAPPTNPAARAHFDRGGKLFTLREFEKALDEYKQGALIESLPVFDLALGQCYRMLRRFDDALWHYDRFIKYGHPTGNVLKGVNDLIAQLRAELDQQRVETKGPAEAPPAAAPQHKPASLPGAPAPPLPTGPVIHESAEPWYVDRIGWALTATGVAGLAVASGLLIDARSLDNAAKASHSAQEHHQLQDKASTRSSIGAVIGIAGAGALVTGIIKLAAVPKARSGVATWNLGVSGDGLMVFGRF